ncbi:S-adenosyl-L-methionine-dependent tRNA 4-demethylwyosine synthase TYW1 (Radical S-adenosyl methionine and flavodoxin domain-containing protein 1) (tRNA wybutosine-synthesizing protein 1 homolog) (tRNA-yW-synthesizing protein) [Durusdinium trenchii]|uniref:Radical SAM core domain-containing protein n=1 Tax=Durusdinium trenchii TaxID=1381693 RepID=A0ABP0HJG0_9DINO
MEAFGPFGYHFDRGLGQLKDGQRQDRFPNVPGAKIESKRTLANDELYVAEQLAKVVEGATPEKTHTEVVGDDRWWSAIFLPLPAPRQLLPEVLIDQKGLAWGSASSRRPLRPASVKLTCEELEELVRVCNCFARMVEPPYLEAAKRPERAIFRWVPLGVRHTGNEVPRYHRALECFDAEAQSCEVPGIAPYGRLVMAVRLPAVPEKAGRVAGGLAEDELLKRRALRSPKNFNTSPRTSCSHLALSQLWAEDLRRLFGRLLEDLATNPFWEGQERWDVPGCGAFEAEFAGAARLTAAVNRGLFVVCGFRSERAYGDERLQLLQKKAGPIDTCNDTLTSTSSFCSLPRGRSGICKTIRHRSFVDAKAVSHLRGVSAGSATTRSSTSHFTRVRSQSAPTGEGSAGVNAETGVRSSQVEEVPGLVTEDAANGQAKASGPHLTRPKRELSVKIAEKPRPQPEPSMELEEEEEEEVPLPPEMVKAEFMQNQLLEPEVVCFVATFSSLFQVLFEAYCDFPQEPRGYGGHMTISAFLRFCFDFGLFSVIDLQTLQRSYNLCSEDFIPAEPQRRKRRTKGSKREANGVFFWNGLQVPQRFEWLTKEFAQHEAEEAACAGVLGAMHDWMKGVGSHFHSFLLPATQLRFSHPRKMEERNWQVIGSHSATKLCRWTKSMLQGKGGCYKHTFYGIASHQCMEHTPNVACANKCIFCWRNHINPVALDWKFDTDDPEEILEESLQKHLQTIEQQCLSPNALEHRKEEARQVRHCALSLVGEPVAYPRINEFLAALHRRRISSFLVTNGQFPEAISALDQVTQLYLSCDGATPEQLKTVGQPLFKDFWERYLQSMDILATRPERTVCRLTLLRGDNMAGPAQWAELLQRAKPDFVEVKGVTMAGLFDSAGRADARLRARLRARAFQLGARGLRALPRGGRQRGRVANLDRLRALCGRHGSAGAADGFGLHQADPFLGFAGLT